MSCDYIDLDSDTESQATCPIDNTSNVNCVICIDDLVFPSQVNFCHSGFSFREPRDGKNGHQDTSLLQCVHVTNIFSWASYFSSEHMFIKVILNNYYYQNNTISHLYIAAPKEFLPSFEDFRINRRKNKCTVSKEEQQIFHSKMQAIVQRVSNMSFSPLSIIEINNVSLSVGDLKYLLPGSYLSDVLIDFGMQYYIYKNNVDLFNSNVIQLFSVYFGAKILEFADDFCQFPQSWIKNDLFSSQLLLLPVNIEHHWVLVAVVNLDMLRHDTSALDDVPDDVTLLPLSKCYRKPCIIVMNSIPVKAIYLKNCIRNFIFYQYYLKYDSPSPNKLKSTIPICPSQPNDFDCGLFVLTFAEYILYHPKEKPKFYCLNNHWERWFDPAVAMNKRKELAEYIINNCCETLKPLVETELSDLFIDSLRVATTAEPCLKRIRIESEEEHSEGEAYVPESESD
ncbi:hypothetical protein P9112_014554 [Eukaryota sp. TZLM1-RC]